jgi:two-component system, NarL family, response regulator
MTVAKDPLRILLADDHEVVREGLASILNRRSNEFKVVAEVSDGQEAYRLWCELKPDVGIFDLRMPIMDGVATIKAVRAMDPNAKIMILTTYDTDEDIYQGLRAGAKGYLLKDADRQVILDAIRAVARGQTFLPSQVATKLATRIQSDALSEKETQVLQQMAEGKSNKQIALDLVVTEGTIKFHANNIYGKLGVSSRASAVKTALERGIVKMGPQ